MIFKSKGFTLVELMIVLVIVAILAAVAFPSYQDSVLKTRRADAKDALLRISHAQERHFTQFARYASNLGGAVGPANLGMAAEDLESEGGYYTVGIDNTGPTTYRLIATPTHADAECGSLRLRQNGQREVSTSTPPEDCW